MNLFELTQQAKKILAMEDMDEQTINDTLEGLGLEDKFANYSAIIKTFSANSDALANAIKQLQSKKQATDNKVARLKDMALMAMQELNMNKAGDAIHSLTIRRGSKLSKLVIDEGSEYPAVFTSMIEKHDIAGLKKAIKDGEIFDGIYLTDGDPSLLIS